MAAEESVFPIELTLTDLDLTLIDIARVLSFRGLVRLIPGNTKDPHADRQRLLAPLERMRSTLVRWFGEEYTADLLARLRGEVKAAGEDQP